MDPTDSPGAAGVSWGADERRRSSGDAAPRLFERGPGALTHGELITLILGPRPGAGGEPPERLARRLVRRHGVKGLGELAPRQWSSERGVGRVNAARLSAAFELGRRVYGSGRDGRPVISNPRDAHACVRNLGRARREHLVGLYLDAQNALVHQETISIGTLNTTRSHPREILYPAVAHLALGFILAHNHPSGCLDPSTEDVEFTRSIRRAGELMGIELYDHIIVARSGYVSLRERGLL